MTEQEYYLAHHGVKGMKWGVRKDKKRRAREEYDREVEAKRNELDANSAKLRNKANKEYRKSYAYRIEEKIYRDGVDWDDSESYWENYDEKRDSHALKAGKLGRQAYELEKRSTALRNDFVKQATIGGAVGHSILTGPLAGLVAAKVTKAAGVKGKKRAAIILGSMGTTVVTGTITNAIAAQRTKKQTEKELGIKSVKERIRDM